MHENKVLRRLKIRTKEHWINYSDNNWVNLNQKPWNKGLTKHTDKRMKKLANNLKGKPLSESHRKSLLGKNSGKTPWNKGIKEDPKVTELRRQKLLGQKQPQEIIEKRRVGLLRNYAERRARAEELRRGLKA